MDAQVPEHHHKDYRIEEKDLIPNGSYVSVVPTWPAPEGTTVNYLNGSDFRLYKMIDGAWRQIGGTSASSAWSLVSYTTAATGASITIPDLDLDTDLHYHIIIHCRNVTASGLLQAKINNDGTAANHIWSGHGNRWNGGANEVNTGDAKAAGVNLWTLNHTTGNNSHVCTMDLGYNSNTPLAEYHTVSMGSGATNDDIVAIFDGAGAYIGGTNITSIVFSHNSGTNCDWAVWVFKAATS